MNSPKTAAAYVGRIGTLAIALGIGAAIASGTAVAWAEGTDDSGATSTASATSDTSSRDAVSHRGPARAATVRRSAPAAATNPAAKVPSAPAVTSAPVTSAPVTSATSLVSRTVAAPGGGSGAPAESAAAWTALAVSRRESPATARAAQATGNQVAANLTSAAVAATPTTLTSSPLGWVTGQRNTAYPGAGWTQTNNTSWANVYGTDLGIMWFNPVNGYTQLAFGDTFSQANMNGDWRSNVLLLSSDTQLYNGLSLINTGPAYQFIPAARDQVFFIGSETTNIPTSAIYTDANNYVSYMSVKSWDTPGRWTTNYSAVSEFDPATDKWVLQTSTIRSAGLLRAKQAWHFGDQNFQQMAYVLEPDSKVAPGGTQYVYGFGTPAGRAGSAFLSRFPAGDITDLSKYEYWDGSAWTSNQAYAAPVLGDSPNSSGIFGFVRDLANNPNFFGGWFAGLIGAKTGGNVSEMSVQYNEYLGKYVTLYGNGLNNVVMRTADTPEGTWSDPVTIATSITYPGLYAPMIHPLSGTGQLTDAAGNPDTSNLYWNMSIWSNYNVVLMKTDLTTMKTTAV